jgi:CHAT domain-containing protein
VAVFADPVFEVNDPRVKRATTEATPESDESKNVRKALRDIGLSADGVEIPRLLASRQEAEEIITSAPWWSGLKVVGFEANLSRVLSGDLANYRIVHFATHGLVNSEHPELSGIVLSLFDEQGRSQDGFLRLHDIYNLHLPADLVVLSACSTGLGKEIKGEGLIGLTRGFMYAGASSVVASLWKVDDEATAELMKHFYAAMFTKQLAPPAALREAQLRMSRDKRWSAPYYWAGFVVQGRYDERVIVNDARLFSPTRILIAIGLLGVFTIVSIFLLRRRRA